MFDKFFGKKPQPPEPPKPVYEKIPIRHEPAPQELADKLDRISDDEEWREAAELLSKSFRNAIVLVNKKNEGSTYAIAPSVAQQDVDIVNELTVRGRARVHSNSYGYIGQFTSFYTTAFAAGYRALKESFPSMFGHLLRSEQSGGTIETELLLASGVSVLDLIGDSDAKRRKDTSVSQKQLGNISGTAVVAIRDVWLPQISGNGQTKLRPYKILSLVNAFSGYDNHQEKVECRLINDI